MVGLVGVKAGMTHFFNDEGVLVPVTVLKIPRNLVLGKKNTISHGYSAVVLAVESKLKRNDFYNFGSQDGSQDDCSSLSRGFVRELRGDFDESLFPVGEILGLEVFEGVFYVDVFGLSKGKGFAGAVKKYGFKGGRATHGSKFHRGLGSTGQSATPSNTKPGRKMAGRAGCCSVATQGLMLVKLDPVGGFILVKGSVPGASGSFVVVKQAIKRK